MLKWWLFTTIAIIFLGFLTACSEAVTSPAALLTNRPDPPPEYLEKRNPKEGNIEAANAGREVYRIHCVMCHGEKGRGDGPVANSLSPKPQSLAASQAGLSDAYLFWRISEGGLKKPFSSAMPTWKNILSEDEIWEIIAFLRTLKD